jgi:hypothetical protein
MTSTKKLCGVRIAGRHFMLENYSIRSTAAIAPPLSTIDVPFYDVTTIKVLFFNVMGTILVFPVEISMVIIRLTASQEDAEYYENWVSTGMLISIMLEDLPQLVLQSLYFAKSGRRVSPVNGTSIFFTAAGLILAVIMSWYGARFFAAFAGG